MKPALRIISGVLALALLAGSAWARAGDDMPVPKSAPRLKVAQQKLDNDAARGRRVLSGPVKLLDGERLRIGDTEIRLFGVVMPSQKNPYGPEARAALESMLAQDGVACRVAERDRRFRLLAQCETATTDDIGLALLQQGWALVARSVVQNTDAGDVYLAAESKAQTQRLGMWAPKTAPVAETKAAEAAPQKVPPAPSSVVEAAKPAVEAAKPVMAVAPAVAVAPASPEVKNDIGKKEELPAPISDIANQSTTLSDESGQFSPFDRDQMMAWLWFAGMTSALVMIFFALGQIALRRYEYAQERRALAAALRGELLAARAICTTRAEALAYDTDMLTGKAGALWPRLRANVYGAHIGRIGLLGADLARKVASLYGQFADYAQYYTTRNHNEPVRIDAVGVQQSLFTLIDHIEETLGNLQQVESSGQPYKQQVTGRRPAVVASAPRARAPMPSVAAQPEPVGHLEYVAEAAAEAPAAETPTAKAPQAAEPSKEKTAEEKIASATSAMMEMLIAEQDDLEPELEAMTAFEPKAVSRPAEEDKTPQDTTVRSETGKSRKGGRTSTGQGAAAKSEAVKESRAPVREAVRDAKAETAGKESRSDASGKPAVMKTEARIESKSEGKAKAEPKPEPKPEFYDFRSQAINIARS